MDTKNDRKQQRIDITLNNIPTMKKIIISNIIFISIMFLAAYFLCDIKPSTEYGWLSAIWHGLFILPNGILHLIDNDILFYSEVPTTVYKIFFAIGVFFFCIVNGFCRTIVQSHSANDLDL